LITGQTPASTKTETPGATALELITAKIDRKIARAQAGTYRGTPDECRRQKDLITTYFNPDLDASPHVFVHGDLLCVNVILDDDSNVQSIIDLGCAEFRPFQFAAEYPRFLVHEPSKNDDGSFTWARHDSKVVDIEVMRADRAFYLSCVEARARGEGGIVADYYTALARKDEISRFWWWTAVDRFDVHKAMAACGWQPPVR
jgi:hypothetical protein